MSTSHILAWPSAGRRISLAESISSLVENAHIYGHSPQVFIASDNSEHSDTGLEPDILEALEHTKNEHTFTYTISTIKTRAQLIKELKGRFDSELLEFALLPLASGGYGVNYNTALLHSAGKKLICTDDDIFAHPARLGIGIENSKEQGRSISTSLKKPLFTQTFGNSDLYYCKNRKEVLDAIVPVEVDIIDSYCNFLQTYKEGQVLLVNPGLYGESGTSSARGVLALDGISREHFFAEGYEALRYSRELVRIPDVPTIGTSVHFMAGQFAADNTVPIAPFITVGRNSDGLASLITRIVHPESLNGYLNFGLYHAPPERSDLEKPNLHSPHALTGYTPGFPDMLMALVVGIAPDMSVIGAENRLQFLGRQLCSIASLSAVDFVDIFYTAWSYQFTRTIEELERLLDVYNREPLVWAEDVDAHIDSLNFYMREPQALFTAGGDGRSRNAGDSAVGCGLSIEEAKRYLDLYGGLLESWFDLWNTFAKM